MGNVGKILAALGLLTVPTVGGLYAYGKMKDGKTSTGAASVVGGITATTLMVGMALLNYYVFGFNEMLASATSEGTTSGLRGMRGLGSILPSRVYGPFGSDFRQVGMLNVTRTPGSRVGLLDIQSGQRVGCMSCK